MDYFWDVYLKLMCLEESSVSFSRDKDQSKFCFLTRCVVEHIVL